MKLERKVGAGTVLGRRTGWLSGAVLFAFALTAVPEVALAQFPVEIGSTTMDRNRAIVIIANGVGQAGSIASGSSVGNGGFWITTQNPYIFAAGPTIGAVIPASGGAGLDTVAFIGGPFSQVLPGSVSDPKLFNVGGAGVLWDTANPDPAVIEQFPADCTVDATRVAQFPSLGSFQGLPFPGFSDQTVCVATNDIAGAFCDDCANTRMGVEVISTWFAFSVPEVQDFIFFIFRIYNRSELINATNSPNQISGPYDLQDVSVAIAADPDVGDSADDQITFFPEISTMVAWDHDFVEPSFIGTPGFVAFNYLRTPIDPVSGEEVGLANFTLFSRTGGRPDPENPQEWYQGLTGDPRFRLFTLPPTDIRGMAASATFDLPAGQFVEIYGATFFAPVQGAPPEELLGEAPFVVQGDSLVVSPTANFDQGRAPGNPFQLIVETQATAQLVFDLGFIVPTAPPKPVFELIPGDQQVTIVWEDNSVEGINPFAKVARDPFIRLANLQPDPDPTLGTGVFLEADQVIFDPNLDQGGLTGFLTVAEANLIGREVTNPAFNPDFVIQDFQGFRVYRSRTGSPEDAVLIAQFDLADDIIGPGPFCFAAEEVFFEGVLADAVCTDVRQLPIGTNTGLAFALVDRGGEFPSPSTGPGLINGIPVAYSVTAFAVNPGQSPVGRLTEEGLAALVPPAAPLVLESGLLPFQRATPRSNSTALRPASGTFEALTEDGSVCDAEEATATLDTATGEYVDFRDCSNAIIDVTLQSIRPENVPGGDFFLVIDSLTPAFFPPVVGAGGNTAWFHWEDAGGGLATIIQPTVGSIAQTMNFADIASSAVSFGLDTNPDDTGVDLGISANVVVDYSVIEDLEINDQSLHLGELGGTHVGEHRPHRIDGSSLADVVGIGNSRDGGGGGAREYAHPGNFAQGGTSYELTWSVEGSTFSGTLRQLPGGNEVPQGGQPKGPENPSAGEDFFAGWNWGFIGPDAPAAVQAGIAATGPLTNSITLTQGATFAIFVPGQSVYIQGIQTLPQNGDVWTFLIDSGFQRGDFGREGGDEEDSNLPVGPFHYNDFNTLDEPGFTNLYPGARWKLSLQGGSNELADADLSQIRVVPNPFVVTNAASAGVGRQNILFTNLPPQATIRIFTISGNLLRVIEHNDGSGTEEWDARTRFDLVVASGNYYFHVTTPDGQTHLGRFAVVN